MERYNNLHDKRILVTGGTSGIGRAIALQVAEAGADVAFCGLSNDGASEVVEAIERLGRGVFFQEVDLSDLDDARVFTRAAIEALGGLDGVVNNAGTNVNVGVAGSTYDMLDRAFHINFFSAWAVAQEAYPALKQSGGGMVVNISSIHVAQTMHGAFPYNASKAALSAMTQSIAIEWAADNIMSVAVAPGWILTPLNLQAFQQKADPDAELRRVEEAHLLGQMGRPEDVASFVVYLLSDGNRSLNGNTVIMDGGMHVLAHPH